MSCVAFSASTAGAAAHSISLSLPVQTWGVEARQSWIDGLTRQSLRRLRTAGINTVFVDRRHVTTTGLKRLQLLTTGMGLRIIDAISVQGSASAAAGRAATFCAARRAATPAEPCVVLAPSLGAVGDMASKPAVDAVLVALGSPHDLTKVHTDAFHARVVLVLRLNARTKQETWLWKRVIAAAAANPSLDLAVEPERAFTASALDFYSGLLSSFRGKTAPAAKLVRRPRPRRPCRPRRPRIRRPLLKPAPPPARLRPRTRGIPRRRRPRLPRSLVRPRPRRLPRRHPRLRRRPLLRRRRPSVARLPADPRISTSPPSGSDSNSCAARLPHARRSGAPIRWRGPGQVVEVAAGSYGYQRLAADPTKASGARVVFWPASGAGVSVSTVDLGQGQFSVTPPSHVAVQDMRIDYLRTWGGTDLVWQNIDGKHFDIGDNTSNVSVLGGDYGPCQAPPKISPAFHASTTERTT